MNDVCSMARDDSERNLKPKERRLKFSIQENVRSTIQRFGMTEIFLGDSSDLSTTESSQPNFAASLDKSSPLYPPSANIFLSLGYLFARFLKTSFALHRQKH